MLINVGSVLIKVGQPFVPAYVVSKFALRGRSEALRADVAGLPDVHVCTVFPYALDTPHFEAGANYVGRDARPVPPALAPERVARAIVALARHPQRERQVPRVAVFGLLLHDLAPRAVERLVSDLVREWHFGDAVAPASTCNLLAPGAERAQVHGRPPRVGALCLAAWLAGRVTGLSAAATRDPSLPPAPDPVRVRVPVAGVAPLRGILRAFAVAWAAAG